MLARPSVSVFGFPVSPEAASHSFHLTAVVSALDDAGVLPASARSDEGVLVAPAPPQPAARGAEAADDDVETGTLDFYGQQTAYSTRDYFPPRAPVVLNPYFGATA